MVVSYTIAATRHKESEANPDIRCINSETEKDTTYKRQSRMGESATYPDSKNANIFWNDPEHNEGR
jgi:hypothetical protein